MRRLLASYERAIETKDLPLFRSVKPNLSAEEEKRLRKAFDSTQDPRGDDHGRGPRLPGVALRGAAGAARHARRVDRRAAFRRPCGSVTGPEGLVIEEIGR